MDYIYMTDDELRAEIDACKALLAESDYVIVKSLELICNCTSATQLITVLKNVYNEAKDVIANRIQYRTTINACEEELARRGGNTATQGAE